MSREKFARIMAEKMELILQQPVAAQDMLLAELARLERMWDRASTVFAENMVNIEIDRFLR